MNVSVSSSLKSGVWGGVALAEWSKVLLLRVKRNKNQKIPGSPPGLCRLKNFFTQVRIRLIILGATKPKLVE